MMMKKWLPILFLALSLNAVAQSRFEMALRGGASMLMYKSDYGVMSPSYNLGVDLLYSYRSPYVVGFRGGVSVDLAQSRFNMANFHDQYTVLDNDDVMRHLLDVNYSFQTVNEAHNQIYASVPLQLGLHFGNFAIFMGPKIAVPLYATFKQELVSGKGTVTIGTEGLEGPNVPVNAYEHVFNNTREKANYTTFQGDITGVRGLNKYKDINIMASVDVNYYIHLNKQSSIGIGLYCDYALPFLYPKNATVSLPAGAQTWKSSLMWINDPTAAHLETMGHAHNSVLNALVVNGQGVYAEKMQMVSALNYLSCGVRLSYNIGGTRKEIHKHWYKDLKKCQCVFSN